MLSFETLPERLVERGVTVALRQTGIIEAPEDLADAANARRDALRAVWTLQGLGPQLVNYDDESIVHNGDPNGEVNALVEADNPVSYLTDNPDWLPVTRRLVAPKRRRDLLHDVLDNARDPDGPIGMAEARDRLGGMLDILQGRTMPLQGFFTATIFTQTRLNGRYDSYEQRLGVTREETLAAIDFFTRTMPYLGTAVLRSELIATNVFSEVSTVDFRDKEAVSAAIREMPDMAFVAGATTYDRDHITKLNRRLAQNGITTVNGGVAPTLDMHPQRYVADGVSVFLGEVEGATRQLVNHLLHDPTPRIFGRGEKGKRHIALDNDGSIFKLPVGEKVDHTRAYSDHPEIFRGKLATRLESLEMMRDGFLYRGKRYEVPPGLKVHQINTSFGCPEKCSFCATEPFQGTKMRHRDLESIDRELEAVEADIVAVVDQNFTANGRDYFVGVMELLKKHGKRFAYEGELMFYLTCPEGDDPQKYLFDGSPEDAYREQLFRETIIALEVGLEQPVKVNGTIRGGKNPDQYRPAIERLNEMGAIVFGTAIVGMPKELWSPHAHGEEPIIPYEDLDEHQWQQVIDTWVEWSKIYPGLILFPFEPVPGTQAYKRLERAGLLNYDETAESNDTIQPLHDNPVKGILAREALAEINRAITTPGMRRERLAQANFSPKAKAFMWLFNKVSSAAFGSRMQ